MTRSPDDRRRNHAAAAAALSARRRDHLQRHHDAARSARHRHHVQSRPVDREAAALGGARSRRSYSRDEVAPFVGEALRIVRAELAPEIALIGFGGTPLTLAAYLSKVAAARSTPHFRQFLRREPAALHRCSKSSPNYRSAICACKSRPARTRFNSSIAGPDCTTTPSTVSSACHTTGASWMPSRRPAPCGCSSR